LKLNPTTDSCTFSASHFRSCRMRSINKHATNKNTEKKKAILTCMKNFRTRHFFVQGHSRPCSLRTEILVLSVKRACDDISDLSQGTATAEAVYVITRLGWGLELYSHQGYSILHSFRLALGPLLSPNQWVPGAHSPRVKRVEGESNHSFPSNKRQRQSCFRTPEDVWRSGGISPQLTSALDGGESLTSRPGCFTPDTHWITDWVGPNPVWTLWSIEKSLAAAANLTPDVQPLAIYQLSYPGSNRGESSP
jgi:hypothetical protein